MFQSETSKAATILQYFESQFERGVKGGKRNISLQRVINYICNKLSHRVTLTAHYNKHFILKFNIHAFKNPTTTTDSLNL